MKQWRVETVKTILTLISTVALMTAGCVTEPGEHQFGAQYRLIETESLPYLSLDSLFVRVAYSGCNGNHSFVLEYRALNRNEVEVWLRKGSPDQQCQAHIEETKAFRVPNVIRGYENITLLSPDGKRTSLRPASSSIYGKWNWLTSFGGIAYHILTPPPAAHIEYRRDGTFHYYRNDTLLASTTFTFRWEKTFFDPDSAIVIHYRDSLRFVPQLFRIDNDTLKLTDVCLDCYGHEYKRSF